MKPPPIPVPLPPASPNWSSALGGIWRLTYPRFFATRPMITTGVLLLAFGFLSWLAVEDGYASQFYPWISVIYLGGVVPVFAFLSGASAIRDDMTPGSVDYILTRPVQRPVYVASRFLCHVACMQAVYLLAFVVVVGIGFERGVPDVGARIPVLFLAQFLAIVAFAAMGTLAGAFTSRYLILGLLYGGIVEAGIGNTPIQLNRLSILHHIRALLQTVLGDENVFSIPAQGAFATTAYIVVFAAGAIAISALFFSIREFAGQQAKEG